MAQPEDVDHGYLHGKVCRLLIDLPDHMSMFPDAAAHWVKKPNPYRKGDLVKVVMVSRLGDCGVTHDLNATSGYSLRVEPECLEIVEDK